MGIIEWRYQKFHPRPTPRLFVRPNIFETETQTFFFRPNAFETGTEIFFETKYFGDRYWDFFWDRIFWADTVTFFRPNVFKTDTETFFETKYFRDTFFMTNLFKTETETFFMTNLFETETETFFQNQIFWDRYWDLTSDSGFGWEFPPIWISLSCIMVFSKFYICTFGPLPKK